VPRRWYSNPGGTVGLEGHALEHQRRGTHAKFRTEVGTPVQHDLESATLSADHRSAFETCRMPVEAKPLFRPEVVRPHLAGVRLPDGARATVAKWAGMFASGLADKFTERELLADFLADFRGMLGYTRAVDAGDRWTISQEKHVPIDGKYADAVLGDFRPGAERFVVAVEGKGPKDPLDRPHAGRKMSAVDQGYRYAINLPCDWIIVTSMRQTRLYHKGSDQYTYERFDIEALDRDEMLLRRFVFLLGADRVVPPGGPGHLADLLHASEKVGKELTKEFYVKYANLREDAFGKLRDANPAVPEPEVLALTQKILDRVLFCAFCEDRGLLPHDTISRAYQHADPYNPRPVWENFCGLFRAVDAGNSTLSIPAYNGGLFAADPQLDALHVPDDVCRYFQDLAAYEYRPASATDDAEAKLIDVDILGHIFEQSITDLEKLRNELEGRAERLTSAQHASRRKQEGAFYTPAFITRYIVGQAMGSVLADRFEALRAQQAAEAAGTARRVLADPRVYDRAALNDPQVRALTRFWEAWQDDVLSKLRVVDPSCGSGAFLIEAFEQLYQAYERSNDRLEELRGDRTLFDLDRRILQNNLYGVDLNGEAVQIARLSLWIKTARRGKALTSLDATVRGGNSVVADPAVHPAAFHWPAAFPEVFAAGGFDVVVGNPPYVRQEWIAPYKPYLQKAFSTYHGTADLYVYFYELGMKILRPGGRLSFIVTNKWLKAAYGEPLRRYFAEHAWVESVVDFGHAKQIFPDADVFPSIIVARKPTTDPAPTTTRVCAIPREQLRIIDLSNQISTQGFDVERITLGPNAWSFDPKSTADIYLKIREAGEDLTTFTGMKFLTGIKTAFNDAYLIDSAVRNLLVNEDSRSAELIKPYVRGLDINRWGLEWAGMWMITMKSSNDYSWPWADEAENAERVFQATYPAVHKFMKGYEGELRQRQDQGRYWWELRSCAYWNTFERPKIYCQLIQYHPSYAFDQSGCFGNNKTAFIPTDDLFLLGVLGSPLMWWYNWRFLPHMKDEALAPNPTIMGRCPIAVPSEAVEVSVKSCVNRLIDVTRMQRGTSESMLGWLNVEYEVVKPTKLLQAFVKLDSDGLITEIRKVRGKKKPLSLAAVRNLREEHTRTIVPAQALAAEARDLERQVSDLVNQAYGLTPDEVRLMWQTAPPRMPIAPPPGLASSTASC